MEFKYTKITMRLMRVLNGDRLVEMACSIARKGILFAKDPLG